MIAFSNKLIRVFICLSALASMTAGAYGKTVSSVSTPEILATWSQIMGNTDKPDPNADLAPLNVHARFVFLSQQYDTSLWNAQCNLFWIAGPTRLKHQLKWRARSNSNFNKNSNGHVVVCDAKMPKRFGASPLIDTKGNPILLGGSSDQNGTPIVFPGPADVGRRTSNGLPKTHLSMTVFGDSGCRGHKGQDCYSGSRVPWVFGDLVSKASESKDLDLVVHVGDYRYHHQHDHTFERWQSDFFNAAQISLGQVPWAMSRGNHESCNHPYAGEGWFLLFGPANQMQCAADLTLNKLAYFDVGLRSSTGNKHHHRIFIFDTSPALSPRSTCSRTDTSLFCRSARQLETALIWGNMGWNGGTVPASSWIATHRPIWGVDTENMVQNDPNVAAAMQMAASYLAQNNPTAVSNCVPYSGLDCGIKAILAGHQHLLENIVFPKRSNSQQWKDWMLPQQFVVGNSGVRLRDKTRTSGFSIVMDHDGGLANCGNNAGEASQILAIAANWRSRVWNNTAGPQKTGAYQYPFGYVNWQRPAKLTTEQSGWSGTAHFLLKTDVDTWTNLKLAGQSGTKLKFSKCL